MAITNLDGATGRVLWQRPLFTANFCLPGAPRLAVRGDGAIAVAMPLQVSPPMIVIDGLTGAEIFRPTIPPSTIASQFASNRSDGYSPVGQPIIDSDGSIRVEYAVCQIVTGQPTSSVLSLLTISQDGAATVMDVSTSANGNLWPGQVIPDGQGGLLATWVSQPINNPTTHPYQAAHVSSGGATVFDMPLAPQSPATDPHTNLPLPLSLALGENANSAFVSYGTDLVAFDLTSGSPIWNYSAAPSALAIVTSEVNGGVTAKVTNADATETVVRFTSAGATTTAAWSGVALEHRVGNLWTDMASSALQMRAAETIDASLAGWSTPAQRGQNRAAVVYADHQSAAFDLLRTIRPFALFNHEEWGGLICQSGTGFRWSRFVTSHDQGFVVVLALTTCGSYGTPVADVHVHTADGEPAPSKLGLSNDINTANSHPELVFYLSAPTPNHVAPEPKFYRYQGPGALANTWYWQGGQWVAYP